MKTPALKTRFLWNCRSTELLTLSKKRFQNRYFLVNSAKFLITHFFKRTFGELLPRKHSFCLLSRHDLSLFQKQNFPTEYFLGLIYRLGTRVSAIFQTLNQTPIFNPVQHLRRSFFFLKIVNSLKALSIFAKKKLPWRYSTRFKIASVSSQYKFSKKKN